MLIPRTHPFQALFDLQRSLDSRRSSDWLQGSTAARGSFPPINIFQRGDDYVAIVELPGVDKSGLDIQAKGNYIRLSGEIAPNYPENVSAHRRERVFGSFDRTISVPVQIDPDGIKAEYRDGVLALFIPRAEEDKPRKVQLN
ncbi:MAG: Hsp20/alpha crystallin family protein [Alphaproteobacteria bacterium]|nr:Hsp20/alpha crystallin family protein [Alphaproteobacteria bacterium]